MTIPDSTYWERRSASNDGALRPQRFGDQDDLGIPVQGAVDRIFLELGHVLLAEGLAAGRQLHRRVVVDDEGGEVPLLAEVLPVLRARRRVVGDERRH